MSHDSELAGAVQQLQPVWWRSLLMLAGVLVSAAASVALSHAASQEVSHLRELRIEAQRLERQEAMLSTTKVDDVLLALQEGSDALRVRLLDSVARIAAWSAADQLDYSIDAQQRSDSDALTMRMLVDVELSDGAVLIDMLDQLLHAATPWPAALRGCDVQRLTTGQLDVQCALDVLHWPDLDVPGMSHANQID